MKKKQSIIYTIVALCCLPTASTLAACQPTPSEEIVVNKRETDLYSESEQTDVGAYEAPANWSEKIENGVITYQIQADVQVPTVTEYPVIEVTPKYFDFNSLELLIYF